MKIQLVKDWKRAWKFASVQWGVIGMSMMAVLEYTNSLWIKLPPEVQNNIPYSGYIPAAIFALSIVGRLLVFTGSKDDNNG